MIKRRVSVSKHAPRNRRQRYILMSFHGKRAFLLPEGTPSNPAPSYPVLNPEGCFVCSMARAAYTRIGQALNRRGQSTVYRGRLLAARKVLIRMSLKHADPRQRGNACNFAVAAARRYL